MLVVALSDRTPHMLRGSGLVPAAYLLAAVGLDAVLQKLWPRRAALAATAVWVISLAWTATFYFAVYPTLPNLYLEYMGDRVDVGRFIDASDWYGRQLYVGITYTRNGKVNADPFRATPIQYMTEGHVPWTFLDYRRVGDLPAGVPISNQYGYDDPAMDKIIADALVTIDPAARVELYKKFQQLAGAQQPLLNLADFTFTSVASTSVQNVGNNPRWATSSWADTWIKA